MCVALVASRFDSMLTKRAKIDVSIPLAMSGSDAVSPLKRDFAFWPVMQGCATAWTAVVLVVIVTSAMTYAVLPHRFRSLWRDDDTEINTLVALAEFLEAMSIAKEAQRVS